MSSLRLALKQSLQESGGGSFGVGENGEGSSKKKRKKHKNKEKKSSKEKKQNSIRKKERVRPRGRRPGEPGGIKRKRGRPRKYPPADDDDDENDNENDTGEKQDKNKSSAVKQKRSPKGDDDDDNDNDDDFDSENEFSYTEDDSDDDNDSDDSDDDDDDNDESQGDDDDDDDDSQAEDDDDDEDDDDESKEGHYRHHKKGRSRTREEDNDVDGDDDDDTMDESTTMHSDDDGDEEDDDDDDDDEHEQEMEKRRNLHVNSAGAPASSEMAVLKSHLKNYLLGEPQQERLFDLNGNVKQEKDYENQQEPSQYQNTSSDNNNNNTLKGSSNQPQQSKSDDNEDHNNNNHTRDIRKKQRKLIKLKKKNSAANKIQNMFKSIIKTANENQNDKTSSSSEQQQQQQQQRQNDYSNVAFDSTGRGGTVGGQQQEDEHNNAATNTSTSIANNTSSSNYSNKTLDNNRKDDDDGVHNAYSSSSNNFNHLAVSTPVASNTSTTISTNDLSQGNNESVGTGGGGGGGGVSGVIISNNNPDTATDRDSSTTIAGHGGNIVDADVGDDRNDVPVAAVTIKKKNKKKKNKKKNNGQVPAPTSDVLEWVRNLSINKCRKNIAMGMRVKVRFATKVKREGKLIKRKIWYGGRVTAVSEKRQKIRIKYDDGTSEVSKFPDKDVVIDADMNGEHAVPADKFCPPPEMTMLTEHDGGVEEEGQLAEDDDERKPEARPGNKNTAEPTNNSDDVVKDNHEAAQSLSSTTRTDIPSHDDHDEKVLGGFALVSSSSLTIEKPPITPPPTASDPAPSPEEGELSPGITVCKSTEMSEELAQAQVGDESTQFPSGTSTTLSTTNTNIASSSSMTSTVAAMASVSEEHHQSKDDNNNMEVDELKKHHHPITSTSTCDSSSSVSPKPTKKLSIRIPSSSLASIEGFHSPRKSPSVAKTMHNVTIQGSSSSNVDDILTDTPKQVVKRKRTSENSDISEGEGGEQHPPKRRIKVSIGKTNSYDENTTQDEMSTSRETTMTMMNSDETDMGDLSSKPEPLQQTEGEIEEMELAPGVEAPVEKKKKKKKGHGGKSPRPVPMRSSSPKLVISKEMMDAANLSENPPSSALSTKQQKVGSKGSAFSTAASNDIDGTGPKQTTLESSGSLDSNNSTSRVFGRKAAQEANEKLTVKEKQKAEKNAAGPSIESGKKKKKRRRKDGPDAVDGVGGGEESDEGPNETEWPWVQCDSCGKWRVLPDDVKVSSLPNLWYCHMNMYDPKRRSCDAPEQTAKQALKDRKRARKRAKRMEQRIEAESQQEQQQHQQQEPPLLPPPTSTKKSKKIQVGAAGNNTPTISPRPQKATKSIGKLKELKVKDLKSKDQKTKEIKSKEHKTKELKPKDHKTKEPKSNKEQKEAAGEAKKSEIKKNDAKKKANVNPISSALVEQQPLPHPSDSGSDTQKEGKKKGKKGKTQAIQAAENPDTATEATATTAESKKPGRKRGRPARGGNQTSSESKNDSKDEDNVEWVQCDKCEKWRKLPPDISADELPDIWNCSMNTWKPASASCDADEDKADSQHHEVGTSEWQLRQSHAGKYSYRQMIFGSGARKHNRPMSERSRAAESLFTQPGTDEENPHPTTQYSKSSAFLPRMSNFQKANAVEEKAALGIFDVLQYSHLWEELRRMEQNPEKVLSSSSLNISGQSTNNQKLKTYDSLSNDIKHAMQDVVLQTLDLSAMTGEEVIGKAQWYHSSTSMKSVPSIQGYCNTDIIINTLLDLVRDGIVEMATIRDPLTPMSQWVPKYRRVRTKRAIEAVEAIKASRCMKISKPWKQRSESKTTEWITGSKH